jgi:predicted small secreted protein
MRKLLTMALIGGSLALAACNTVRGAAADLNSAANCTENTINGQRCR